MLGKSISQDGNRVAQPIVTPPEQGKSSRCGFLNATLEGAQGVKIVKDPNKRKKKEIEIVWSGTVEVEFPELEGEGEMSQRALGIGKDEYCEWRDKNEMKR